MWNEAPLQSTIDNRGSCHMCVEEWWFFEWWSRMRYIATILLQTMGSFSAMSFSASPSLPCTWFFFPLPSSVKLICSWQSGTALAHILGHIVYWVTSLQGCHISWRHSHVFIVFLLFFFMILSNLSNSHGIYDTTQNVKIGGTLFSTRFYFAMNFLRY